MISAWEAECVADCRRAARSAARRIGRLETIGLTTEDVVNEMLVDVVVACRNWATRHVEKPPKSYLNAAIRFRRFKLYEQIKRAIEHGATIDVEEVETALPDDNPNPEAVTFLECERDRRRDLQALLTLALSPAEIAILKLRSEGWTNTEIARVTGVLKEGQVPHDTVKRQYYRAKKKAADFLRACGIDTVEDAMSAPPEVINAAWEKARRQ